MPTATSARRVTLKEVSERAGVSIGTASRVLNGAGGLDAISEPTRRRVLAAAARLGYRADLSARAVRTGRFGALMLLQDADVSRTADVGECLAGVCSRADEHDMHVVLARIPDERLRDRAPKVFRQAIADGIVVNYHSRIPDELVRRIEALRVPWVLVNNKRDRDCVYPDEVRAGREATERLLRMGHTRVAYLDYDFRERDSSRYHFSRLERLAGYRAAMAEAGLEPVFLSGDGGRPPRDRAAALGFMRAILEGSDRPTGFVGNSGVDELLHVAAVEFGMRPGRDLSAISFGEAPRVAGWTVSAMLVPWRRLGEEAVDLLLRKIERPGRSLPPRVLRLGFRTGETCGPPGGEP